MTDEGAIQRGYRITGRVQGVFYRAWTRELAHELGLRGWVRNRGDGSVEVRAGGEVEAIRALEKRLWEGPPAARVDGVELHGSSEALSDGPFQVLPTA